jgi:hypothetical protein
VDLRRRWSFDDLYAVKDLSRDRTRRGQTTKCDHSHQKEAPDRNAHPAHIAETQQALLSGLDP